MNTITDLFQQAQLAEAAYANFIDPQTASVGWVERSDTHRVFRRTCWASLRLS